MALTVTTWGVTLRTPTRPESEYPLRHNVLAMIITFMSPHMSVGTMRKKGGIEVKVASGEPEVYQGSD